MPAPYARAPCVLSDNWVDVARGGAWHMPAGCHARNQCGGHALLHSPMLQLAACPHAGSPCPATVPCMACSHSQQVLPLWGGVDCSCKGLQLAAVAHARHAGSLRGQKPCPPTHPAHPMAISGSRSPHRVQHGKRGVHPTQLPCPASPNCYSFYYIQIAVGRANNAMAINNVPSKE